MTSTRTPVSLLFIPSSPAATTSHPAQTQSVVVDKPIKAESAEDEVVGRKISRAVHPLINRQLVKDDAGEVESGASPSQKARIDLTSEVHQRFNLLRDQRLYKSQTPTQYGDLQLSINTSRPVSATQNAPNATATIKSRIWSKMKRLKQQRATEQKMEHEIDGTIHKLSQEIKALNAKRTAERESLRGHQLKMEETEEKIKKLENLQATIRETEPLLN